MTTDPSRIDMRFSFHEVIGSLKILSVILFACGLSVALKPVTLSASRPCCSSLAGTSGLVRGSISLCVGPKIGGKSHYLLGHSNNVADVVRVSDCWSTPSREMVTKVRLMTMQPLSCFLPDQMYQNQEKLTRLLKHWAK